MSATALSVIIPAHNAAATIAEQLEALSRQHGSHVWEIVVVDNRSSDGTAAIVRGFQPRMPNLRLIEAHAKVGAAYATNAGARSARGSAFAFCDADDVVAEGWVAAMEEALERHAFVSGPLEVERLNRGRQARPNPQPSGIQDYREPPFLPHAAAANMGVRRDVFEMLGGFDESLLALFETDFCWRAQLRGITLTAWPQAVVHYRFRRSLADVLKQAETYARYNVLLYKRYRPLGMPHLPAKRALRGWVRIVRRLPDVRHPVARERWVWDLGWRLGRLHGSVKYRVFSP